MRTFVALVPPPAVLDELDRFLDPRRDAAAEWRWSPRENWHVTLAFLGDVDDSHLVRVEEALAGVAQRTPPFELRLDGAGAFPHVARTKHVYQAVAGPGLAELHSLAGRVRNACQHAGANPDGKPFTPHLTVARGGQPRDATAWLRVLATFASAPWTVDAVTLFGSHLGEGRGGSPRYDAVETYPLAAGAGGTR